MKTKSIFFFTTSLLVIATILLSCSKQEDFSNLGVIPTANLENGLVYRKASLKNQIVTFKLYDDNGEEIVENVTFYVNETPLDENTFSSEVEGTFSIYAQFLLNGEELVTETEEFNVITPAKKVVVEDYTGTWCGYCPSVTAAIEEVLAQTSNISVVAIHNGDDLSLPVEPIIREGLNVPEGSPRARIDRTVIWGTPAPANFPIEEVLPYAGTPSSIGIGIESFIDGGTIYANVTVASEVTMENMKLVLYLVEDGIIREQTNYYNQDPNSPYYNLGNPIPNFEHNHTFRGNLSDVLGDEIPETPALTDYVASFSLAMDPDFVAENLHLVAMVVNSDNLAINSQNALVGENKSFE